MNFTMNMQKGVTKTMINDLKTDYSVCKRCKHSVYGKRNPSSICICDVCEGNNEYEELDIKRSINEYLSKTKRYNDIIQRCEVNHTEETCQLKRVLRNHLDLRSQDSLVIWYGAIVEIVVDSKITPRLIERVKELGREYTITDGVKIEINLNKKIFEQKEDEGYYG